MKKTKLLLFLSFFFCLSVILNGQIKHIVDVSDFAFTPKDLTVTLGDTVMWQWVSGLHTTTSDSTVGPNSWNVPITNVVQTFSIVLTAEGLHRYYCIPHGSPGGLGMAGTITVTEVIPVELSLFSAVFVDNSIHLKWQTITETNNYGFEVERRLNNESWQKIGFVKGKGHSTTIQNYKFIDDKISSGNYSYRLRQVDFDGRFEYSFEVQVNNGSIETYSISQNYPNPFNPVTSFTFNLPVDAEINLKIYNAIGKEINYLQSGTMEAGSHEISFIADDLESGVYFYKIEAKGIDGSYFTSARKMIYLK